MKPQGLKISLVLFALGVCALQSLPELPPAMALMGLFPLLFIWRWSRFLLLLWFLLGFLWAWWAAIDRLAQVLPSELENKEILITGRVEGLVEQRPKSVRFLFKVHQIESSTFVYPVDFQSRLNWYRAKQQPMAGETWRFKVKLKRPHGLLNPAGFNYENWLFQKNIRATGYVRDSTEPVKLAKTDNLSSMRSHLKARLLLLMPDSFSKNIMLALILGDKSGITREQWRVFTQTGTNHLVAISGLHIGIIAGLFFALGRFFWRLLGRYQYLIPAQKMAVSFALVGALLYAALAGFSIPTQRALIMLAALSLSYLFNVKRQSLDNLLIALFAVLLWDPFAVLNMGFWLSFGAVGAILLGLSAWHNRQGSHLLLQWVRVQWVVSLGLIPILMMLGLVVSLLSPVVNLISIPLFSFCVVPLVLFATGMSFIWSNAAEFLFILADTIIIAWYQLLSQVLNWGSGMLLTQSFPILSLCSLGLGILLLLSPKGMLAKPLGLVLCLPLFFVQPKQPKEDELWLDIMDVGQGLSVIVRTQEHTLIFDTGDKFSSGFNMGEAVIVPYLRQQGVSRIDRLILSNGDQDHQGGTAGLLKHMAVDKAYSGEPDRIKSLDTQPCLAGDAWQWDGVEFEFLHPNNTSWKGNDASCVLSIRHQKARILLTADIEKPVERWLLQQDKTGLAADIVVAPHHGSRSSSTREFIQAVSPLHVVFPAGHLNRYGFPKPDVVERWRQSGAKIWVTGEQGAIRFRLSSQGIGVPMVERDGYHGYWLSQYSGDEIDIKQD